MLAVLPGMRERRYGQVINVLSAANLFGGPGYSAYVASKAALDEVCASFQAETLSENVTFTSIYMPLVRTAMVAPNNQYLKAAALSPRRRRSSATRSSTGRGGWARRWDV